MVRFQTHSWNKKYPSQQLEAERWRRKNDLQCETSNGCFHLQIPTLSMAISSIASSSSMDASAEILAIASDLEWKNKARYCHDAISMVVRAASTPSTSQLHQLRMFWHVTNAGIAASPLLFFHCRRHSLQPEGQASRRSKPVKDMSRTLQIFKNNSETSAR